MKKRIFKYLIVKIIVVVTSSIMLFLLGIGLFDLIEREDFSMQSVPDKFTIIVVAILFLLKSIGFVSILSKFSKSILLLNIYYIFSFGILVLGTSVNVFLNNDSSDLTINLFILFSLSTLIFFVNKFKYKEIQYESIESIGTQND